MLYVTTNIESHLNVCLIYVPLLMTFTLQVLLIIVSQQIVVTYRNTLALHIEPISYIMAFLCLLTTYLIHMCSFLI